jgi:predicted nucleotidyltransferase
MVAMKDIRDLSRRIVRQFRPRRIVLFGSYAEGRATPDSDVDLLVILPHRGKAVEKSVEISWCARRKRYASASPWETPSSATSSRRARCCMKPMTRNNRRGCCLGHKELKN